MQKYYNNFGRGWHVGMLHLLTFYDISLFLLALRLCDTHNYAVFILMIMGLFKSEKWFVVELGGFYRSLDC